jgi:hypothetical protein
MKRFLLALAALAAVRSVPALAQKPAGQPVGRFVYVEAKDPITDENVSSVAVQAQGATPYLPETLLWRCEKGGGHTVMVDGNLYGYLTVPMVWRFDQRPPQSADWAQADSGRVALREGQDAFTAAALGAQRVAVRVTVANQEKTFIFPLDGARAAFAKLPCLAAAVAAPAAAAP